MECYFLEQFILMILGSIYKLFNIIILPSIWTWGACYFLSRSHLHKIVVAHFTLFALLFKLLTKLLGYFQLGFMLILNIWKCGYESLYFFFFVKKLVMNKEPRLDCHSFNKYHLGCKLFFSLVNTLVWLVLLLCKRFLNCYFFLWRCNEIG